MEKYFTPKIISLTLLIIICLGHLFISRRLWKEKQAGFLRILSLYVSLILVQCLFGFIEHFSPAARFTGKNNYTNISGYIFLIGEFSIFTVLLKVAIGRPGFSRILTIITILFLQVAIIIWFSSVSFFNSVRIISSIESIVLIPFCLFYFQQLLKQPPVLTISISPHFWMVAGLLVLLVCLLPFYLFFGFFGQYPAMEIVDHIAYMAMIGLFTKSVLVAKQALHG